jgi:hypothetical protein
VTATTHIDVHRICRNILFRQNFRRQPEAERFPSQKWRDQVQESQRPNVSFAEAAARYVDSIHATIETDEQLMYDGFISEADEEYEAVLEDACMAQVLELCRLQQEAKDRELAIGLVVGDSLSNCTDMPCNWHQPSDKKMQSEKEKQEVLDRKVAEQLQAEHNRQGDDREVEERCVAKYQRSFPILATGLRIRSESAQMGHQGLNHILAERLAVEDDAIITVAHKTTL